jgi:hypothetical protein
MIRRPKSGMTARLTRPGCTGAADGKQIASAAPEESLSRWHTAILAGLQAMALWLGERPGRRALLTALGVGAATGLLAYLAGPVFGAGAAVLSTVVSPLADGTRLGVAHLLHRLRVY